MLRHGPLVLGVCRRVLKQADEAEDCFQAVFLVLLRKAATIDPTKQLANWLYGVAYRTALKARALSSKRRSREKQVMHVPEPTTMPDDSAELLQLLDQELSRLPEKYRVPILLCELPGKSYKEAADSLGISPGALSVRLVRARGMLAKRLARHGLAVSIGLLSLILIKSAAGCLRLCLLRPSSLLTAGRQGRLQQPEWCRPRSKPWPKECSKRCC